MANSLIEKSPRKSTLYAPRWGFITPALIYLFVMTVFPLVYSFLITFTDMRLLAPKMSFIGLDNWKRLFSDRNALTVLGNTLTIVFVGCFIQYSIGMLLAILVNMNVKFLKFFRIVFLLPMMVAPIAISYVIGKMVFSESYGPINDILFRVGLPIFQWTDNPLRSMAIVIGIDTWSNVPFFILVLLGGLQAIPDDLIEAARVDGATDLDLFTQIIFPLMIPISITTIMIRALNAFQIIDVIRIITGGGPGNATESATLFAYDIGIKGQDIGYGSTVSFALLIVIALFTIMYLLIGRKVTVKK